MTSLNSARRPRWYRIRNPASSSLFSGGMDTAFHPAYQQVQPASSPLNRLPHYRDHFVARCVFQLDSSWQSSVGKRKEGIEITARSTEPSLPFRPGLPCFYSGTTRLQTPVLVVHLHASLSAHTTHTMHIQGAVSQNDQKTK
jgi:hypothetical protein